MEYININDLGRWRLDYIQSGNAQSHDDMIALSKFIGDANTIDIIRCKDCRWGRRDDPESMMYCTVHTHHYYTLEDGFCNLADRK